MAFRPVVGSSIEIEQRELRFTEHPCAKGMPYGQSGKRATVFQAVDRQGNQYALKVFTLAFQSPKNIEGARKLSPLSQMPGLQVCRRLVITPENHSFAISQHPDLAYAVLMPWVTGETWQEYQLGGKPLTEEQALNLALKLAVLLSEMEKNGLAHCDISGANVMIVSGDEPSVALIDVEEMFAPGLLQPDKLPAGTPGYNHKTAGVGLWRPDADRFAGAVLLAEVLGWCDERVRRIAYGEQYFDPFEMQAPSDRLQVLRLALREHWGERFEALLLKAWYAETLEECPPLKDWYKLLTAGRELTLEERRAEIDELFQQGEWAEVFEKCSELLNQYPNQFDINSLKNHVQALIYIGKALKPAWEQAEQSGSTPAWEKCQGLIRTAASHAPHWQPYQQMVNHACAQLEIAQLLDEVETLLAKGDWPSAENLLSTLPPLPTTRRSQLASLIQREREKRAEAEACVQRAQKAVAQKEWLTAVDACRFGMLLKVNEYVPVLRSLLETASAGLEAQNRLNKAVDQVKEHLSRWEWQLAADKTRELLAQHPDLTECKNLLQTAEESLLLEHTLFEAREAFDRNDFSGALALLQTLPPGFMDAAKLEKETQDVLQWQQQVQQAYQHQDARQLLYWLSHRPRGAEDDPTLRLWAEKVISLSEQVEDAIQKFNLQEAATLLSRLPADHPAYSRLQQWYQPNQQLWDQMKAARDAYRVGVVAELLETCPGNFPNYSAWAQWVSEETARDARLRSLRASYGWQEIQAALEAMPTDHPAQEQYGQWAEQVGRSREAVEQAVQGYDLAAAEAALALLMPDDPIYQETGLWLEREKQRSQQVQTARDHYEPETVTTLLQDAPPQFPQLAELRAWAEQEALILMRARNIRAGYDLVSGEQLHNLLPDGHPLKDSLKQWLEGESQRAGALKQAKAAFAYQDVLNLLESAPLDYPHRQSWHSWAINGMQMEERLRMALQAEDEDAARRVYQELPDDHPQKVALARRIHEMEDGRKLVAQLEEKAKKALREKRWSEVVNYCRQAIATRQAGPVFQEMLAEAEEALQTVRGAPQTIQEVRAILRSGDTNGALMRLHSILELDPRNEEARLLFLRIREQLATFATRAERSKKWADAGRIWKNLQDMAALPGAPDPFVKTAAEGVARVQQRLKQQQQQKLGQLMLIILVVLVVIAATIGVVIWLTGPQTASLEPASLELFLLCSRPILA